MGSISPGLPQIQDRGLEEAPGSAESGIDHIGVSLNQAAGQADAASNSPDAVGAALSGLSQDLGGSGGGRMQGMGGHDHDGGGRMEGMGGRDHDGGGRMQGMGDRDRDGGGHMEGMGRRDGDGGGRMQGMQARQSAEGSQLGAQGGSQNGGGQFGSQLGSQYGSAMSKQLGGQTGGQLGGDAASVVSDLQNQAQASAQGGLGGALSAAADGKQAQQAETQLQNDDAKAREARGEGVAQANADAKTDVQNFVAQQTQTSSPATSNPQVLET